METHSLIKMLTEFIIAAPPTKPPTQLKLEQFFMGQIKIITETRTIPK